MQAMVRVLSALFLELLLISLSQQRPTNQQTYIDVECDSNNVCVLVTKSGKDRSQKKDTESGLKVETARSTVILGAGQETTLSCNVVTQHDPAYIKTIWYREHVNIREWKLHRHPTPFDGGVMSWTITGTGRDTRYRCKACLMEEPVMTYGDVTGDGDTCTFTEIMVRNS